MKWLKGVAGCLAILAVAAGCTVISDKDNAKGGLSRSKVTLELPSGVSLKPNGQYLSTEKNTFAGKITSIELTITSADMSTPIAQSIPLATLETTIDVPSGSARTFAITILTDAGMTFTGSQTVDLTPGAFIDVVISVEVTGLAPAAVTASAGTTQVALAWDAVPGATSYNIYWSNSAGVTKTTGAKIPVTTNSYTHTGLTAGTPYYYIVTAVNDSGETGASAEVSAIPAPPIPAAPTGVGVSAGDAEAAISWTAVTGAASYNVYYQTTAGVTIANGTKITGAVSGSAITGLANGATYYFVVTAVNAGGESGVSAEVAATPQLPIPAAPTGVGVSAGDAEAAISWTAVTGAASYNVYYQTTAGVTIANGTKITGAVSGSAITGLTNGATYYFVVTAVNAGGESGVSAEVAATPQLPIPAVPTGVGVSAGNAEAAISWTAVTGAASYNVYYQTTAGVTIANGTKITGAVSGSAITGLTNGATYYFVVTAVNAGGESGVSAEVAATPQLPIPAAPTAPLAAAGDTQVTVSWAASAGAASYNVYYRTAPGVTSANGTKVAGAVNGGAITGLTNGAAYYFIVTAVNAGGESGVSAEVAATPQPPVPGAPTGIMAVGGNAQVTVSWVAISGATTYNVYYRTTPGVTTLNGTLGASGVVSPTTTNITSLTNGTIYYFIVTAVNGGGESAASSEVASRPGLPGPAGVTASSAGSGAVKLSWNPMGATVVNVSGTATVYNISGSNTAYQISGAGTVANTQYTYNVYWSTTTGVTPFNWAGSSTGISNSYYDQTGLTNGTTYYYVVTAIDPATGFESLPSAQASAVAGGDYWTTKAAMPTAHNGFGAASLNGIIYAVGGYGIGGAWGSTVEAYDPITNTWSTKASMPTARGEVAAAVVNGILYAIGGWNGADLGTVEAYNFASNTWVAKAPMTARSGAVVEAVDGIIYVIGGSVGGVGVATVEAYDPVANTWSAKAAMPTARVSAGCAVINGKIYVMGGNSVSGGAELATVEEYYPATNTWAAKTSMPTARYLPAAGVFNGTVFAIGGKVAGSTAGLASVEAYDPIANTWSAKTAMPTTRYGLGVLAVNGLLYAIGGSAGGINLVAVEAYTPAINTASNTWSAKPSMITARSELALCALNGKIYAIGGYNGSVLSSMEEYDTATGAWTTKASMSTPRSGAVCTATGGKIHVMGGYDGASYLISSETYDPALNTWSTMAYTMSAARYNPASAELNGKAYVMGGTPNGSAYASTVDIFDYTGSPVNQWTSGGAFATGRYMAGAESYGGKLFLMGGSGGVNYQDIQSYDPVGATWTSIGNMPLALYGFGIANLNGLFYISGGTDGVGKAVVYSYNPATGTWKTLAGMGTTRWYHKSVAVNGKVYVVGGAEAGSPAVTMLEYTP